MNESEEVVVGQEAEETSNLRDPDVKQSPYHSGFIWFITTIVVAVIVGGLVYFATGFIVSTKHRSGENTDQIVKNCMARNEQVAIMNQKFTQLSLLFDLALKESPPEEPPPGPEILRALEEFRNPIALIDCSAPL